MLTLSRCILNRVSTFSTFKPAKFNGPSYETVKKDKADYMMPFYKPFYDEPFYAVQGHRQYLYDDKGDEYLDLVGGISCANVGHCHPRLNKVYAEEAPKLLHISQIYYHEFHGEYLKALCEQMGEEYDVAYLTNSGSEANDLAYNIARTYTSSERCYSLRQSYHGIMGNSYSLSSVKTWNSSMPKLNEVHKLAWPNSYRRPNLTVDDLITDAEEQFSATSNGQIAGVWAEPVMGAGGIMPLPQGYLPRLHDLVKKYNGVLICDEIQTGFGRIGKEFWGFKWAGIKPDIIVTAKAMANGYPMGAVITKKKIMSTFKQGYFNTYGGGPLQCRLGMQVLKILKEEKLAENADLIGNYFQKEFKRISQNSKVIGDVRGKGMMVGFELVENKESKKPSPEIAAKLMNHFKKERVLISKVGEIGNILRATGPLCLNMEDAKKVVSVLEDGVKQFN